MRHLLLFVAIQSACSLIVALKNPDSCNPSDPATCDDAGNLSLCQDSVSVVIECGSPERCLVDEKRCDTCNDGLPNPNGELCFEEPPQRLPAINTHPSKALLFDFDGDSKQDDLAVLNENTNDVSVFRNTSSANEVAIAPIINANGKDQNPVRFPIGAEPNDLAVGDFNGDGRSDLAAISFANNTASVLLRANSGFTEVSSFQVEDPLKQGQATKPRAIAAVDLNGDGLSEIVTANFGLNSLGIFVNNIANPGTFVPNTFIPAGGAITQLVVGDLNEDSRPDLIALDNSGDRLIVFLGKAPTNGIIAFESEKIILVGNGPTQCILANILGDSKLDIITVNEEERSVSVIQNLGNGALAAANEILNAGTDPVSVTAINFDGDSDIDLVLANKNTSELSLMENQNNATLTSFSTPIEVGATPVFIVSANLNSGDSFGDLIIIEQTENRLASLAGTNQKATPFEALTHYAIGEFLFYVTLALMDGDTDLDILTINGGNANVGILLNQGELAFHSLTSVGPDSFPYWVSPADINNDGRLDMVTANGASDNISIFLAIDNNANFGVPSTITPDQGSEPFALATADFDGDGDIDIASAHELSGKLEIFNNETPAGSPTLDFQSVFIFSVGTTPQTISLGNFDGNQSPDLVVSNADSAQLDIFFNEGGIFRSVKKAASDNTLAVVTGDINGDQREDIVSANADNSLEIFLGTGSDFLEGITIPMQTGDDPKALTLADFDKDGDLDIATANKGTKSATLLQNNGVGGFSIGKVFPAGNFPRFITSGDINGDGIPDIITANNQTGDLTIIRSQP